MGCSCDKLDQAYDAYLEIKNILKEIRKSERIEKKEVYLIKSKDIKNFLDCIGEGLKDKQDNPQIENQIKDNLNKYEFKKIEIMSDYEEINSLSQNESKNQLIIVDERFFKSINRKVQIYKFVNLSKDGNVLTISCDISKKEMGIEEIRETPGIFKFVKTTTVVSI